MKTRTMTATALARNLSKVLDELARGGEEIAIERNKRIVGRLVPGPAEMTATEMFGDLYGMLTPEEARAWEDDIRTMDDVIDPYLQDPWASS